MKLTTTLMELLWDSAGEEMFVNEDGFTERFVGPNKIIREGTMSVGADHTLKYTAVITLKKLVPNQKAKAA